MKRDARVWAKLMLIAFVANGLGPFGLKVLSERKLADYQPQYLFYWYLGGLFFALLALFGGSFRVNRKEVALGAFMGLASFCGQAFTGLALSHDVPGYIAFPLTTGGSLFLVATAGILLFKEKVGPYGIAGLMLGIIALVTLSAA